MTATSPHVHGMLADLLAFRKRLTAAPRVGHSVRFRRPFVGRAADFTRELQALTKRYGVAVAVYDHYEDGNCGVQLVDAPAGCAYETHDSDGVTVLDFEPVKENQ